MKNWKTYLFFAVLLIGLVFTLWGAIGVIKYPGYWELAKEATKEYWLQYTIGIGCFMVLYIFLIKKNWIR